MPVTLTFTISFWWIPFVAWLAIAVAAFFDLGFEDAFKMWFIGTLFMALARWLP
mgnify:CR=1 FL=1